MNWAREYRQSMKAPEAEDRIDLLFYRPLGFVIAKLGWRAGLSPTHLTLLGAGAGILAGFIFYVGGGPAFPAAAALFLLSGIFDSADGQLARISGRSTPFGLVLDGICDNLVFAAIYIGCALPLMEKLGWWVWPIAVAAGLCHSLQSSLLDFYNREYLYYAGPGNGSYWNPLVGEAKHERGWLPRLRLSWLLQQQLLSTRPPKVRLAMKEAREKRADFGEIYRRHNLFLLHLWRPLGANVHTLAIIVFAYLARFELYLILIDIILLNVWLLFVWRVQKAADREMLGEAGIRLA